MGACDLFYDKSCNIRTEGYTRDKGSHVPSKAVKYSGISCFFENDLRGVNRQNGLARETDNDKYLVYLPITYNDVVKGELIELIDSFGNSIGEYIIDTVDVFSTTGVTDVDNVLLQVSNR